MPRQVLFPHPVAGTSTEDLVGNLSYQHGIDATRSDFTLTLSHLAIDNPTIASLIAGGQACFAIQTFCPATYLRLTWLTNQDELVAKIPASRLLGNVTVKVRVVARETLADYHPDGLHPDYGEATFRVETGDVLAVGPEVTFDAAPDFDPLSANAPSIMHVRQDSRDYGPMRVNLGEDHITVELAHGDWLRYQMLKSLAPQVIHPAIVMPALAHTIQVLRDGTEGDHSACLWHGRLQHMLVAQQIPEALDAFTAAQQLLRLPFGRMCEEFERQDR